LLLVITIFYPFLSAIVLPVSHECDSSLDNDVSINYNIRVRSYFLIWQKARPDTKNPYPT